MRTALLIAGGIVGLVGLAALVALAVGLLLPREHVASGEVVVDAPAETVYAAIADVAAGPRWRSGVRAVEVLRTSEDGEIEYLERSDWGAIRFLAHGTPPRRFESEIRGEDLPFGGSWTFELAPEGAGTRVRITERGFVANPFFRFLSRFVFGHESSIRRYLADLEHRFPRSAEV